MERFRPDGHLTDQALAALVQGAPLDELARLEIAEHLSYCDQCLQRYTDLLTEDMLLNPAHSCQASLWNRIRSRALRLAASRYATAAAAVAIALTLLWGSASLPAGQFPASGEDTCQEETLPRRISRSFDEAFSRFSALFDAIGAPAPHTTTQGGNYR